MSTIEARPGQYHTANLDWSVNDPEPDSSFYDPESGSGNPNTVYNDPEAPPAPTQTNSQLKNRKPLLTIETEPSSLFLNPSRIPRIETPQSENDNHTPNETASTSYSFAAGPPAPSSTRLRQDSFGGSLSGGTAPTPSAMVSPHDSLKQVPHQVRRPLTSRLRVNSSEATQSTMGGIGGGDVNRRFHSPTSNATTTNTTTTTTNNNSMHPGSDIIWQGCYLWKIPYSSNKVPKVRWVQSVHDVAPNGGRGVYLKWHDPKNTRKQARSLALSSVAEIVTGQKTNAFFTQVNKRGRDTLPPVSLCFSLICNERTVDLAATNEEDFKGWISGLRELLSQITILFYILNMRV